MLQQQHQHDFIPAPLPPPPHTLRGWVRPLDSNPKCTIVQDPPQPQPQEQKPCDSGSQLLKHRRLQRQW
jgi:hypothetical protein